MIFIYLKSFKNECLPLVRFKKFCPIFESKYVSHVLYWPLTMAIVQLRDKPGFCLTFLDTSQYGLFNRMSPSFTPIFRYFFPWFTVFLCRAKIFLLIAPRWMALFIHIQIQELLENESMQMFIFSFYDVDHFL